MQFTAMILIAVGCSEPVNTAKNSLTRVLASDSKDIVVGRPIATSSDGKVTIDAGVIFASEASYICVPLSQIGVEDAGHIQRIESSCDCVRPIVTQFVDQNGRIVSALRLDFAPEGRNSPSVDQVAPVDLLSVELTFSTVDLAVMKVNVNFLYAYAKFPHVDNG